MKDEIIDRKHIVSDLRWYGIASYIKEMKYQKKSNEGVPVETLSPVEFPDHLGQNVNILI